MGNILTALAIILSSVSAFATNNRKISPHCEVKSRGNDDCYRLYSYPPGTVMNDKPLTTSSSKCTPEQIDLGRRELNDWIQKTGKSKLAAEEIVSEVRTMECTILKNEGSSISNLILEADVKIREISSPKHKFKGLAIIGKIEGSTITESSIYFDNWSVRIEICDADYNGTADLLIEKENANGSSRGYLHRNRAIEGLLRGAEEMDESKEGCGC